MARRTEKRLTAKQADGAAEPGRYRDGGGLMLDIDGAGRRAWVWRYTLAGRTREMGLGPHALISLAQARAERDKWRVVMRGGCDPIDARAASRATAAPAQTFGEVADTYIAEHRASWRNSKHAAQWVMTLDVYARAIRAKPVREVSTADILSVLKPIWQAKAETASRLRGRLEMIIDAARAIGHIPEGTANPARWRGHLDKLLARRRKSSKGHFPAMPFAEVPAFVALLREEQTISARALEFTILTAARSGETRLATPAEFDFDRAVWTVPAERMKAGRIHRVALSPRAVEIVRDMLTDLPGSRYVFPGRKRGAALSDMAMTMCLRRRSLEYVAHGFRSSFADWRGEATSFPKELAEAALAHIIGDETEAAYRRGDALDRRRGLMTAWADFIAGGHGAQVVRLRPKAR